MTTPFWLSNPTLWLCLLAGAVGAVWALGEIVGKFNTETGRALRTAGGWLLILVNFGMATLVFLLIATLTPTARSWPVALLVGLSWPTVFRNLSLKIAQPIDESKDNQSAAIRLEELYGSIQKLALQLINSRLTRQRMQLLMRTTRYALGDLEKYARQMSAVSPQHIAPDYIDQVVQRNVDDDYKKALLVALLMDNFTRDAIDDFIRENRNRELRS